MRTLTSVAATAIVLAIACAPANAAEDCTEEAAQERQTKLMAFMQENPDKQDQVMAVIAEVEKKYGGEPNEAQTCNAMDDVLAGLKKL